MKKNPDKRNPVTLFFIALITVSLLYFIFYKKEGEAQDSGNDSAIKYNFIVHPLVNIRAGVPAVFKLNPFIKQQ